MSSPLIHKVISFFVPRWRRRRVPPRGLGVSAARESKGHNSVGALKPDCGSSWSWSWSNRNHALGTLLRDPPDMAVAGDMDQLLGRL